MSLLRSAIGTVLRRLRHQQRRTLQDVADAAGVSMPYLSEIERGRKEASSEILASICAALGVPLTDLLEQVRAELLRTSPLTSPVRAPRMLVTCGSALGRSAHGRDRRRRPSRAAGWAVCRPTRLLSAPSSTTLS
jgi:transcriptional regulator with XRE-family HTH domain